MRPCNVLLLLLSIVDALQVVLRALYRYLCANGGNRQQ